MTLIAGHRPADRRVLAAKLVVVAALLYGIARRGWISPEAMGHCLARADLLAAAIALLSAQTVLCIARWRLLVGAHGVVLGFRCAAELTLIGMFFNVALPGSVSGDFVKAYYVAGQSGARDPRVAGSIVFDRLVGLSALVLVAFTAMLLADASGLHAQAWARIRIVIVAAAACVLGFLAYVTFAPAHRDPLARWLGAAERKLPRLGLLVRVYEGTRLYRRRPRIVLAALCLSAIVQVLNATAIVLLVRSLGDAVPLLAGMAVAPLGLLVGALPVLPMGIGTGHAAFAFLLLVVGSARGADAFSLGVGYNLLCGALGGLAYLRVRRHPMDAASASA